MLKDKIALVSGASRGIGKAISLKFAEEGATVFAGIRNESVFENYLNDVPHTRGKIIPIFLDVCDINSIKQCVMKIKKEYGCLDILVNNAGLTIIERFEMMKTESLHKIFDTNVFGVMGLTQICLRLMKKSSAPSIINMASIMADNSDIGQAAYGSSKAAIVNFTKTLAKEYADIGLRVNSISPGNVDTDMFNIIEGQELQDAINKIGMKRVAKPEEIANVALFLASDLSSYVTGENILVNGGLIL